MKKLNKKGFTLIEMLVVLVLLTVIMAIAIPSITSTVERSKAKDKKIKIELAKSAAGTYIDEHGTCTSVKIQSLIENNYLPGITADEVCDNSTDCCYDATGEVTCTTGYCPTTTE